MAGLELHLCAKNGVAIEMGSVFFTRPQGDPVFRRLGIDALFGAGRSASRFTNLATPTHPVHNTSFHSTSFI